MHGEVKGVGDAPEPKKAEVEVKPEADDAQGMDKPQQVNVADLIDLDDEDGKDEPEEKNLAKSVYVDPLEFKPKQSDSPAPAIQPPPAGGAFSSSQVEEPSDGRVPGGVKLIVFLIVIYAVAVVATNAMNPKGANGLLFFSLVGLIGFTAALFTMSNLVRNLLVVFAGLCILFNLTGLIDIFNEERTKQAGITQYEDELQEYKKLKGLTASERKQIAVLEKKIEEDTAAANSISARAAYLPYAARIAICTYIIIYLLMPKTRARFSTEEPG
jgi:hypothetical protein